MSFSKETKFARRGLAIESGQGKIRQPSKKTTEAALKRIGVILLIFTFGRLPAAAPKVDFARSLAVKAPADLVLRGGKVITVDGDFSIRQAVAVRDGRFVASAPIVISVLSRDRTRGFVDLAGRTVIPGLIDSHVHATADGLRWDAELHWEQMHTLTDGLRQIDTAAKAGAGKLDCGRRGWVPTQFAERRFPTRAEIDTMAPNHPVYIQYLRQGAAAEQRRPCGGGDYARRARSARGKFERIQTQANLPDGCKARLGSMSIVNSPGPPR